MLSFNIFLFSFFVKKKNKELTYEQYQSRLSFNKLLEQANDNRFKIQRYL
ncbi:hypothetical protein ACFSCX_08805 [Bacillus salitolerans]|uniref:YrzI family small protein n=1 Tax=Bacillus salitolerans TaxID=1437434 RepID=A0ABW4LNB6_9BACI